MPTVLCDMAKAASAAVKSLVAELATYSMCFQGKKELKALVAKALRMSKHGAMLCLVRLHVRCCILERRANEDG